MEASTTETAALPGLTDVPAVTFRHFRGDEDYPALLELNTGSKIADDLGHDLFTLDLIRHVYGTTSNHVPAKDVIIAEADGKAVAFNRLFWEQELDGARIYWHYGFVLPEWRDKGIGRYLVQRADARACEIETERAGTGPAYLSTSVYQSQPGLLNLMSTLDYQPVRYEFHMETPNLDNVPDVPVPDDLEIRPAEPEHYRAVWDANVEAFKDHWGAIEVDDSEYERFMADPTVEPRLWVVAWDGDQVAGSILNYINYAYNERSGRKLGYTESISVRRPWRRRGLARAMLARSMRMFRNMGMTQTALGVDTENASGALQLYESLGYEVKSRITTFRKPL